MNGAVNPAMARAAVDYAKEKNYSAGVLGFRAPVTGIDPATFVQAGQEVRLVPCVSSLAVWEAILTQQPEGGWLVVVTDRPDEDLGPGLLAQFVGQRLRRPEPWQAVQQRFSAQGIDAALVTHDRAVATGLLSVTPPEDGWPPAPAGVLTAAHAFGAVARHYLDFPSGTADSVSVLDWAMRKAITARIASLRVTAGDHLTDAVLRWLASAAGPVGPLLSHLISQGTLSYVVPLGLVLDALSSATGPEAQLAKARLQHRWAGVPHDALTAAGPIASAVVADRLEDKERQADAQHAMARADELAKEAEAETLMAVSPLLRSGLLQRVDKLASLILEDAAAPQIEEAWRSVREHRSATNAELEPTHAAVRLLRWLAVVEEVSGQSLEDLSYRQADVDAWVDHAVNDAATGVDLPQLAQALERVLKKVKAVRDRHDREFAAALAQRQGTVGKGASRPVHLLENVVADVVAPIAKKKPALLLVLDGLSTGVATELVDDLTSGKLDMVEALLPKHTRRAAALAVLPTVTEFSRTSLLTGTLQRGDQQKEAKLHPVLTEKLGLGRVPIFHKKALDSSRPGHVVADEVRAAILDTEGNKLVTCVLNTIDDALDRSDPGGTPWNADAVKHLVPLVRAARDANRAVIIASDHGHVIERRRGYARAGGDTATTRWRPAGGPVEKDEVLVAGPRVLAEGAQAVLAVDEGLRYGPLKAGYHGGAAPAEVVVPLVLLVPAAEDRWQQALPHQPAWWSGPLGEPAAISDQGEVEEDQPALIVDPTPTPVAAAPRWSTPLRKSKTFKSQPKLRRVVTEIQVAALIDALQDAPHQRIAKELAAQALGVPAHSLAGALAQVMQWLNVDGYRVLSVEPATQEVLLDAELMAEQFGIEL